MTAFIRLTCLLLSLPLFAQPNDSLNLKLNRTVSTRAKLIATDRLGNLYGISATNRIFKVVNNSPVQSTYNYPFYGNIYSLDPGNPFQLYLFYRELNLIAFLDNNLALRGEIRLADVGIGQATSVARSYDNKIWLFDAIDLQLKKLDRTGVTELSSGNVLQYIHKEKVSPIELVDNGKSVFVNDTINGILVFDLYCAYQRTIPVVGAKHIQIIDENLYYLKNDSFYRYNMHTFRNHAYAIPGLKTCLGVLVEKGFIYLLKPDEIAVYSY